MKPHPEGGKYKEVFRSAVQIATTDHKPRSALTHIYFSLMPGEKSLFHKVSSDEIWNLYDGDGLTLITWDFTNGLQKIELSKKSKNYCHIVPANVWQAASPLSSEVLVGCSVAPGFEFSDFELIDKNSDAAIQIAKTDASLSCYF